MRLHVDRLMYNERVGEVGKQYILGHLGSREAADCTLDYVKKCGSPGRSAGETPVELRLGLTPKKGRPETQGATWVFPQVHNETLG